MNQPTETTTTAAAEFATLTPAALLGQLASAGDRAPMALIDACAAHGEAMVEALRGMIVDESSWGDDAPGHWWLPVHAAFILGRMSSESAGLLLVQLMRNMDTFEASDIQDWVAGQWPAFFANKPQSAIEAARELAEDTSLDWYMRCQAVDVVLDAGLRAGDDALEHAIDWAAARARDEDDDWYLRISTASTLLDFPRERHREQLVAMAREDHRRQAHNGFVGTFGVQEVDAAFARNTDTPDWHRLGDPWKFYDPDAIAQRQARWQEEDARRAAPEADTGSWDEDWDPPPTYVRATPKTGRNDACPCGSGKKYKQCCLNKAASVESPADLTWRRMRREMEGLPARMLRFTNEAYGAPAINEAWAEFMLWDANELTFDPDSPHLSVFLPWFLHCWAPDPDATEVADADLLETTPAQLFLQRQGRHLAPALQRYLQACIEQPFSFYEVVQCDPGHGMTLQDVLTGERHDVLERKASQTLGPHHLIFAQLACVDGITMLEATSPIALRVDDKVAIIALRQRMRAGRPPTESPLDNEALHEWAGELRELYLALAEPRLNPSLPELRTTDGEAIEFHKLIYDIDSAQTAFDALKHLDPFAGDFSPESDSKLDADKTAREPCINWTKTSLDGDDDSNTVLGTITLDANQLVAQVNSRERAERIKAIIEERLAGHATFRMDDVQSFRQALDTPRAPAAPQPSLRDDDPDAQAMIAAHLRKHYAQWIDSPLPILDDRTPREVAKTADGREQVESLVQGAEQIELGLPASVRQAIFDNIRQQLRLTS
jgi:hypothetical protein